MKHLCKLLLLLSIATSSFAFAQYHGGEKTTFEGLALGMELKLPECPRPPMDEKKEITCQTFLSEETVKQNTMQNYRVRLGSEERDTLSGSEYMSVGTINSKVAQITIITTGLSQQEQIYVTLQERLGDPDDNFVVSEQDAKQMPHLSVGSIMAIWVTKEGQISFIGELNPQGYGIITMHTEELLAK
ncbi:MAG: hypothetical protein ACRCWR_11735 [Saezia sp.]